ncbi:MAG: hypothetical protein IKZ82_06050 [Clostridia bacterium]|nr:hypothetical protein [Clostridia bacterium]
MNRAEKKFLKDFKRLPYQNRKAVLARIFVSEFDIDEDIRDVLAMEEGVDNQDDDLMDTLTEQAAELFVDDFSTVDAVDDQLRNAAQSVASDYRTEQESYYEEAMERRWAQ